MHPLGIGNRNCENPCISSLSAGSPNGQSWLEKAHENVDEANSTYSHLYHTIVATILSIHRNVNKSEKANVFHRVEGKCCSLLERDFQILMVKGKESFVRGGCRKKARRVF